MSRSLLFLPLFVVAISCSRTSEVDISKQGASGSPGVVFFIDPTRMGHMEQKARAGDIDAMQAIAMHYDFAVSEPEKAIPWLAMAVDHGSVPAMRGLAIHLAVKGGEENCRQAESLFLRGLQESKDVKQSQRLQMSLDNLRRGNGAGACRQYLQAR